jgi:hypothetical protein
MDMDNAATWLAGMILITIGIVVIVAGATLINNIIHRYWKPVRVFTPDSWTLFGSQGADHYINNHPEVIAARKAEERIAPVLKEDHDDLGRSNQSQGKS